MPPDFRKFDDFAFKIRNPFWSFFFMFTKLPSAFFSGVSLVSLDETKCSVSVRHTWFTKNPFKSMYFACLAMAAEMSTGVLAMGHTYKLDPPVSMIVAEVNAKFLKKATGKIIFSSDDGDRLRLGIRQASANGTTTYVNTHSYGKNKNGDIVAHFIIVWAFKLKAN